MKRWMVIMLAFCLIMLLSSCNKDSEPTPSTNAPQLTTPIATPIQTPALTTIATPTQAESLVSDVEEDFLTWGKALIQKANIALAPFFGDAAIEGEPEIDATGHVWLRLKGYTSAQQLRDGLDGSFTDSLADTFFIRCTEGPIPVLKEENGGVWVRQDSHEVLGQYYDIDLNTLAHKPDEAFFVFCDDLLTAEGFGNGTPVYWRFGLSADEDGTLVIGWYECYGIAGTENDLTILVDGKPYGFSSVGGPNGMGKPYLVSESDTGWPDNHYRTECYDGLSIVLCDRDDPGYMPWYITVTRPGIPTNRGVEVGDTLQEVLAAYPQFTLGRSNCNNIRDKEANNLRSYPSEDYAEYQGNTMCFYFDDSNVLTEVYLWFDLSN